MIQNSLIGFNKKEHKELITEIYSANIICIYSSIPKSTTLTTKKIEWLNYSCVIGVKKLNKANKKAITWGVVSFSILCIMLTLMINFLDVPLSATGVLLVLSSILSGIVVVKRGAQAPLINAAISGGIAGLLLYILTVPFFGMDLWSLLYSLVVTTGGFVIGTTLWLGASFFVKLRN
ncbi:hypothetical protein ACJJIW_08190 [Microbulbifer sp. JMSA004]|uniref:hypothetical protein n=1 Tax=Microbulbifer sp. JMSA004 TaxID=3243370 RepID=UPI0040391638